MKFALVLLTALAATPEPQAEIARVGSIFAGGVLDLIAAPKRDVTVSFATLVSAPIGYPKQKRAVEFNMIATSLDEDIRELNPRLIAEAPSLVGLCVVPESATRFKLEALVQGKTRAWTMQLMADTNLFGTPSGGTRPPQIFFAALTPMKGAAAERLKETNCTGALQLALAAPAHHPAHGVGEKAEREAVHHQPEDDQRDGRPQRAPRDGGQDEPLKVAAHAHPPPYINLALIAECRSKPASVSASRPSRRSASPA